MSFPSAVRFRWAALVAVFVSLPACSGSGGEGSGTPLTVGDDIQLEGRVVEVDATPMFVDGDGEIILGTEDHGQVLVRVPARERPCRAQGLGVFPSIAPSDSIRVIGRATGPGELTVCVEETHVLEKLEQT